jgi:hypothetical protein
MSYYGPYKVWEVIQYLIMDQLKSPVGKANKDRNVRPIGHAQRTIGYRNSLNKCVHDFVWTACILVNGKCSLAMHEGFIQNIPLCWVSGIHSCHQPLHGWAT